jgi:hypothetical protein
MKFKDLSAKNVSIKKMTAEQKMIALGVIFIVAAITVFVLNSTGLREKLGGGKEVPQVAIYYSEDKVHIPAPVNEALGTSSYNEFQVRKALSVLNELDKANKLKEQEREGAQALTNIIEGLTEVSNFDGISTQYFHYKIINEGSITVEDLRLVLPGTGYAEIHKRGQETIRGIYTAKSTYNYRNLNPGDEIAIDYWTNSSFSRPDHVTGLYKNGMVKVKPMKSLPEAVESQRK